MRLAVLSDRACLIADREAIDVERASSGRFGPDIHLLYENWSAFRAWGIQFLAARKPADRETVGSDGAAAPDLEKLLNGDHVGSPAPRPGQVFAIGLNYHDHAEETGTPVPTAPPTFTKFQSCLAGPNTTLVLSGDAVDFEVELVVVIGSPAKDVSIDQAWGHVAGLTVGQDFSDRPVQTAGPMPQFSLGKSFPGYGPMGPLLVTPDEFENPDDLALECLVNGEQMQKGRTSQMVFPVADLIARLSAVAPLMPGDIIFTGTPAGVGMARKPPRFLRPGDEVVTSIGGIGSLHTKCVAR